MGKNKPNTARRREVRRSLGTQDRTLWQTLRQPRMLWCALFVLTLTLLGSLIAWWGQARPNYMLGQTADQPIVARVDFRAIDPIKTQERRQDAYERQPAVYEANRSYLQRVREQLMDLGERGADESLESLEQVPEETRRALQLNAQSFKELKNFLASEGPEVWVDLVDQFVAEGLFSLPVLDMERARLERDPRERAPAIMILHPTRGEMRRADNALLSVRETDALESTLSSFLNNKVPRSLGRSMIAVALQDPQPTYRFNEELTRRGREAARDAEPAYEQTYQQHELLVRAGEQIDEADLRVLAEEKTAYRRAMEPLYHALWWTGRVGLVLVIGIGLWGYIAAYGNRVFRNPMRGLGLTGLLLAAQALAVLGSYAIPQYLLLAASVPTLCVALVLAIAYDQRFALGVGYIAAALVVVSLDMSLGLLLPLLAGVAVAAWQLDQIRTLSKLVATGSTTGLAMAAMVGVWGLLERPLHIDGELGRLGAQAVEAFVGGFATGLIVLGALPVIQLTFKVTTAFKLRELNDASHPLLRRLAERAPGTYQHSLRIADMGEAAAEAIGVNGLLCRVGAMYHDIGKMNKPQYFVENQGGGPNRHNKLSPAMSHLIIIGHVKDGVEMAREYALPPDIRQFIETHHGTTLVEYFFHAAKQRSDEAKTPGPSEFEFRYPGPKPQTKEAAILMLCDSIEGAVRAMSDPNASRIEQMVHNIANKRLMDGQFDECNLTLQELHRIEVSLVKTLCAIYHGRIKYPGQERAQQPRQAQPAAG